MCGRFELHLNFDEIREIPRQLGVQPPPDFAAQYRPRFNVAPTDPHWIIRAGRESARELVSARWGPIERGRGPLINTRIENKSGRSMLVDPAKRHRCVVLATGFFEWVGPKKDRRPIWFHRPDPQDLMLFGAICIDAKDGPHFSILTTTPNEMVARAHNRMPVIVPTSGLVRFLTVEDNDLAAMLSPTSESEMAWTEVSQRVNSVRNDDPGCLEPASPALGALRLDEP